MHQRLDRNQQSSVSHTNTHTLFHGSPSLLDLRVGRQADMGEQSSPPPAFNMDGERWRHLDSSVSAVSFGFVATAVLILMFLVMAIFERFLRSSSAPPRDAEAPLPSHRLRPPGKLDDHSSPKMSMYARGVSVLMPGQSIPTFIAHPAPRPCDPERIAWPTHEVFQTGDAASIPS